MRPNPNQDQDQGAPGPWVHLSALKFNDPVGSVKDFDFFSHPTEIILWTGEMQESESTYHAVGQIRSRFKRKTGSTAQTNDAKITPTSEKFSGISSFVFSIVLCECVSYT